jgi:uncharacterized protein (TIGR02145 family)
MAQNLNFKVDSSWWYNNSKDSGAKYGRLYNWAAAMALPQSCNAMLCDPQVHPVHQGICPVGWHIPRLEEWLQLSTISGNPAALKSKEGWVSIDGKNASGTDDFGFQALPSRYRQPDGSFSMAVFNDFAAQSATEQSEFSASCASFADNDQQVILGNMANANGKLYGQSIRCIRND